MKKKSYEDRQYALTEDEMQDLVMRAQRGDGSAQLQLIEVFENFLSPYIKLLFTGKYNLQNYDMRRFLELFVKDSSVRFLLRRNKLNAGGFRILNEIIRGIVVMVQRYGTIEDVEQTVKLAFLESVNIYEPKESKAGGIVPFSGYIYNYFYYVLKKKVDTLLIDQLGRKTFPLLDDSDFEEDSDERPAGFVAPPTMSAEDSANRDEIDEYWVSGTTAHGIFAALNPQERQLLRWRYIDGERSSDIAHRITEHPNTTREHLSRIRAKLREYLLNQEE